MDRLAYEPRSLWRAKQLAQNPPNDSDIDNPVAQWFGWGKTESLLADIFDGLALNTDVTAKYGSKKRPKLSNPYPRPGAVVAPDTLDQAIAWLEN